MKGGPQNFLDRLTVVLDGREMPDYQLINPSKYFEKNEKNHGLRIARLDGVFYYKLTSENLYNFIKQRRFIDFLPVKYVPDLVLEKFTYIFNYHLNRFNRRLISSSDALIFQSELSLRMHTKFIGEGLKNKPHTTILNGVPTSIFHPMGEMMNLEGTPRLVITASFRLHKRLHEAIRIVNKLSKKHKTIKLHVIGSMDILTEKNMSTLDCTNVIFHGNIDSKFLPNYYSSCDVGLSPSLFDPCPNSVVEMVACGLPVITLKESGAAEIIKHPDLIIDENIDLNYMELQTVEKLPALNVERWCDVIENILDNKSHYSESMLARVEEDLDINIVASRYAKFITRVHNVSS
jgi:glycosyltransferase involved in cell wall biosynthesis